MNPGQTGRPDQLAHPRHVTVSLGLRSYDILIGPGLLSSAGARLTQAFPGRRFAIVTDDLVAKHYLAPLEEQLAGKALAGRIVLPAGEATKSFHQLQVVCDGLIGMGLERRDLVIALGGGVIGDLAGFAASIVRRGIGFVQVPTSLLAQVDSSVGGKTGINTARGKNLVGSFHQPSLVLADTSLLATLAPRQLRAGYAEVVKYGLLGDAGFFEWLEHNSAALLAGDTTARTHAVETSCRMKAGIVARDETESGERMLLNLGHTFGHALEAWAGFGDRLLHGEAIAIGMCLAFELSEQRGIAKPGTALQVAGHLAVAGLPTRIADIPRQGHNGPTPDELIALMSQDKKVASGTMTFILARAIGDAFITRDVGPAELREFLSVKCEAR